MIFYFQNFFVNKQSNKIKYKNSEENLKKILSFPINKNLSTDDVKYICKNINMFYKKLN